MVFGSPYDARADVYSFGIVMAEMLCCRVVGSTTYMDAGRRRSRLCWRGSLDLCANISMSCALTAHVNGGAFADSSFLSAGPSNRFKVDLSELRQAAPESCPEALVQVRHLPLRHVCFVLFC